MIEVTKEEAIAAWCFKQYQTLGLPVDILMDTTVVPMYLSQENPRVRIKFLAECYKTYYEMHGTKPVRMEEKEFMKKYRSKCQRN